MLVLLPCRCRHDEFRTPAVLAEHLLNIFSQGNHVGIDETPRVGRYEQVVAFRNDSPHVVRCLHRPFHRLAHLHHALRNLFQTEHQCLHRLPLDDSVLLLTFLYHAVHAGVVLAVFLPNPLVETVLLRLDKLCRLAGGHTHHHFCRRGDGRICLAHLNRRHVEIVIVVYRCQKRPRQHDGTRPSLVDVHARVSALSAFDAQPVPPPFASRCRLPAEGDAVELQVGACRPCRDGVVVFRIEVNHLPSFDKVWGEVGCSRHAVFLVRGRHHLERSVHDILVFQHCQRHRQTDAVVGTERRAARLHPAIFLICLDGGMERVVHPHAHHIHVVQYHDGGRSLATGCRRLSNHDAVLLVAIIFQPQPLGKVTQKVCHFLLVVRRTGHRIQLFENLKNAFCCTHIFICF